MALGGRLNHQAKAPKSRHPYGEHQHCDDLQSFQFRATQSLPRQSVSRRQPRILLILSIKLNDPAFAFADDACAWASSAGLPGIGTARPRVENVDATN